MSMTATQLAEERRWGRYAGAAAIGAAAAFPAGLIWSLIVNRDRPTDNDPAELRFLHDHSAELIASSALGSIALLLLAVVAVHLYRAILARKPDVNRVVLVIGVFGPVALAIGGLAYQIVLAVVSADFAGREFQTVEAAEDLLKSPGLIIAEALRGAGTLALAIWFVMGSLNAMRVGLLTRFMGVLGIILGPGLLLPIPTPVVMTFWLIALGALFLGFWPRGLPPAWTTGEAVPWPSPGDVTRQEVEQANGSRDGDVEAVGPGVRKPDAEAPASGGGGARRKRKRGR
jgi:hypothetical protein